jgi:hypothetical protein
MISDLLALGNGTSTKTYTLRAIVEGKSIRGDSAATLGEPRTVTISHSLRNPKDPSSPQRHLVRLDETRVNSLGVKSTASVYMVVEIPQDDVWTDAVIDALMTEIVNFADNGGDHARFHQFTHGEP